MKRIGIMAVHYGKDYLAWAARSLGEACDKVLVFYASKPTFGFSEGAICPETEEELHAEATRFCKSVVWHRVPDGVYHESHHRTLMLDEAERCGAKLVAIADADEVWDPSTLRTVLASAEASNSAGRWLARFHNFWRSWKWTVTDEFRPVRIVDLRHPLNRDAYLWESAQPSPIYHFGYAQNLSIMRYKFTCHGHKAEFRPNWFERKFLPWTPSGDHLDLHPCVNHLWRARPTSEEVLGALDELLADHPHRNLELIT